MHSTGSNHFLQKTFLQGIIKILIVQPGREKEQLVKPRALTTVQLLFDN